MKRRLRTPFLVVLLALVFAACSDDGPSAAAASGPSLDDLYDQLADDGFNGVVMTATPEDVSIVGFGTADGPDGALIDEHTVFDIGSITKQFTGAAIVRLEMEGLVSVDDPVGVHLPELRGALAEVTLHQLLTHTSGLPDGIGDDYEAIDRAEYLERAMDQADEPGEYQYSNVGYSLLGMVIESVTGGGYEQYLHDALFVPAGMDSTGYVLPDWDTKVVAVGNTGDRWLDAPHELPWADDGPWWNLRANGGILSTADDMRRWHEALLGDKILSGEAKEKLLGRHVEEGDGGGTYYGYGWVSIPLDDGDWLLAHNGGNGIFFADMLRVPDDELIVFTATNRAGADEDAARRIFAALVGADLALDCRPTSDATSFPVIGAHPDAAFPATTAGTTAEATLDILLDGDEAARRTFAERHVSDSLAQGLSLDEQVAELALLQEEFVGYTGGMVHMEDDHIFHAVLDGSPSDERVVISVEVDPAEPQYVSCVHVEYS